MILVMSCPVWLVSLKNICSSVNRNLKVPVWKFQAVDFKIFKACIGRMEEMGVYVAFNSLGHITTRQKPGTENNFPSLHK